MRYVIHSDLIASAPGVLVPGGARSLVEARGMAELEHEVLAREGAPATLLRIEIESLERRAGPPDRRAAVVQAVFELLRASLKDGELFAWREGPQIVALLARVRTDAGESLARRVAEGARKLAVAGLPGTTRVSLSIGIAGTQSESAYWFETLLAVAQEGVLVASHSGSECAVHTQLYALVQKKLERENPRKAPAAKVSVKDANAAAWRPGPLPSAASNGAADVASVATNPVIATNGLQPAASFDELVRRTVERESQGVPGDQALSVQVLEEKVITLAHEWAQEALRKGLAEQETQYQSEVELLERRLRKLAQALEQTESELERVRDEKYHDSGVASAYRGVQGLSREESLYEHKRDLLSKILEANLDLRMRFARGA